MEIYLLGEVMLLGAALCLSARSVRGSANVLLGLRGSSTRSTDAALEAGEDQVGDPEAEDESSIGLVGTVTAKRSIFGLDRHCREGSQSTHRV